MGKIGLSPTTITLPRTLLSSYLRWNVVNCVIVAKCCIFCFLGGKEEKNQKKIQGHFFLLFFVNNGDFFVVAIVGTCLFYTVFLSYKTKKSNIFVQKLYFLVIVLQ